MPNRINILFTTLFFIIGFVMTIFGLRSLFKVWKLERRGIRTVGRIIDISDTDEDGTLPVIEYVTRTGEVVQKKSSTRYDQVQLEQEIPLIYDEQHPYQMVHDSFGHKYTLGIFLLMMGIPFMSVAALSE